MKKLIVFLVSLLFTITLASQDNVLDFDGNNDYIELSDNSLFDFGANNFTVETRVKLKQGNGFWENTFAVAKWNSGEYAGTNEWALTLATNANDERPRFVIESGSTKYAASAPSNLSLNVWHHLAGVRDGGEIRLYVDGTLVATNTNIGSNSVNDVGRTLRLATNSFCCGNNFSPRSAIVLNEVRIWNVARTEQEIQDNMNGSVPAASPGLVAYYLFDQGTPCGNNSGETTLIDATNGLNGVLLNFALTGCTSNYISESPLPVELTDFRATVQKNDVRLEWHTASESSNEGFEVQRTQDFHNWKTLGFLEGKGFSSQMQFYHFTDKLSGPGNWYYRLRQLDYDGKEQFSPVVSVTWQEGVSTFRAFPNPAQDELTIECEAGDAPISFSLFNAEGRLEKEVLLENGYGKMDLANLPPGVYCLRQHGLATPLKIVRQP